MDVDVLGSYLGLSKYLTSASFILFDIPFALCLIVIAIASYYSPGTDREAPAHRPIYSLVSGAILLAGYYLVTHDEYGVVPLTLPLAFSMNWLVAFAMLSHWPYRLALTSASAISILLFILLVAASNDTTPVTHLDVVVEVILMIVVGAVVIFVARPVVFTRQLCFLLFLFGAVLVVNEISKLGLNLQPPNGA